MTDRLAFVALRVRDLETSVRFYRDVLGVPLEPTREVEGPFHYECSWREGAYLHFALFPAGDDEPTGHAWLGFSTSDVEALHERASRLEALVLQEPRDEPWGRTATYRDPDGNVVALTQRPRTTVAGVDACRGGWAVAIWRPGSKVDLRHVERFAEVLPLDIDVIAVDIPIGAPELPPRAADVASRTFVGRRASSVFPTPPRSVLDAADFADALRRHRDLTGQGLSKQAFYLCRRMLEVEPHALRDERIVEVHPEVSFRELAGREVVHSKHTAVGVEERLALLAGAGIVLPDRPRGLPLVDALDAAVAAWTAARWSRGDATPLPAGHTERIGAIWR